MLPIANQVLGAQALLREAPYGQGRAVDGERGDDGVDARAVLEPRVHHGAGLVDAPPDSRDDAVYHAEDVCVVLEMDRHALQLPAALDIDGLAAVDQDVGDGGIGQQGLERPEAQDLVLDLLDDALARRGVQGRGFLVHEPVRDLADLAFGLLLLDAGDEREVHDLEEPRVDAVLPLLLLWPDCARPRRTITRTARPGRRPTGPRRRSLSCGKRLPCLISSTKAG